jgi:hypothetical protein
MFGGTRLGKPDAGSSFGSLGPMGWNMLRYALNNDTHYYDGYSVVDDVIV